MRFLLVNQFYPPDMAPTGQYLHELARCLVQRGHDVEVWCSRRSYDGGGAYAAEEVLDGVRVRRAAALAFGRRGAGRAADYVSFLLATGARAAAGAWTGNVTLCLTTPPYVGWLVPRALGRATANVVQWVMDLYPDVLVAHGATRDERFVQRRLRRLTEGQFRRSALVLALGDRAREKVRAYVPDGVSVEAVPLWTSFEDLPAADAVKAVRGERGWHPGELVLLYSGNMGLGHRMREFLEAADRLGGKAVWAFAGGGARRAEVESFVTSHPEARVQLLPYVGQADLAASLAAADVHLLSLRSPWQGLIVPSKLQAAFGLGRPVIYVGPRDSEAADWILASGGGWAVNEGDIEGVLRAVAEAGDPGERSRRGEAGRAFARLNFDRATNTRRIADLLERACLENAN